MNPQATPLIQAKLTLPFEQADEVSDLLMELGALAVSLEDANADSEDEQPLFGEPGMEPESAAWNLNHVVALFRNKAEGEQIFGEIPAELLGEAEIDYTEVPQEDWVRLTQSQFDPIPISARLWIVPSWHEPQNIDDRINLVLDPGLAFGTGSHPTTALCLRWLSEFPLKGQSVLDYGCGSGILAIAAMKLGAASACGIDIDPQAVLAAQQNAQKNGVDIALATAEQAVAGPAQIVVANILANPLTVLAPLLARLTRSGGRIALSGILVEQADAVLEAYAPKFTMTRAATDEGWVLLTGRRNPQ